MIFIFNHLISCILLTVLAMPYCREHFLTIYAISYVPFEISVNYFTNFMLTTLTGASANYIYFWVGGPRKIAG